ncbi:MAG: isoprenoid biosynthesis glyoxalase ElbB [Pseudobdellovibrionaceae bacterium]|nr:isoprenoid biosynthesis glyoxalase ElbB [Bdellovibrionales bacterium]USN46534.1 MAG: isoprenoid biosynthesis glyoxalase ElbB [Pseudobdellovibrionaceae bacterium]
MKKIAVVLSGCGFKDGSELTEAVSTLIALSESHANYKAFSPSVDFEAVDHLSGEPLGRRNTLSESARISRGQIADLTQLNVDDYDALVFPGGYGAAKNLCDWASKGAKCQVHPQVEKAILDFHQQNKPIGAICIAPALVARVLGSHGVTVTIGNDVETSREIEKTGAVHVNCPVDDYVTDRETKVITTPAYMYDAKPHEVFTGIQKLVRELVEMA